MHSHCIEEHPTRQGKLEGELEGKLEAELGTIHYSELLLSKNYVSSRPKVLFLFLFCFFRSSYFGLTLFLGGSLTIAGIMFLYKDAVMETLGFKSPPINQIRFAHSSIFVYELNLSLLLLVHKLYLVFV